LSSNRNCRSRYYQIKHRIKSMRNSLRINGERLCWRLDRLAQIGRISGDGVCRLALSDEDKQGRDLVVDWMREVGLSVRIDRIGNVVGTRPGLADGPPVMTGSHIDSVRTGGQYDGALGVLAGLEVIAIAPRRYVVSRRVGINVARSNATLMLSDCSRGLFRRQNVMRISGLMADLSGGGG
jgi:hypothetical protein